MAGCTGRVRVLWYNCLYKLYIGNFRGLKRGPSSCAILINSASILHQSCTILYQSCKKLFVLLCSFAVFADLFRRICQILLYLLHYCSRLPQNAICLARTDSGGTFSTQPGPLLVLSCPICALRNLSLLGRFALACHIFRGIC